MATIATAAAETTTNPSVTKQAAELVQEAASLREKIIGVWSGATRFAETLEGGWACQHLAEAYHALDHATAGLTRVGELRKDSFSHKGTTALEVARLENRFAALSERTLEDQAAICRVARRLIKHEGYATDRYSDEELLSPDAIAVVKHSIILAKELIGLSLSAA